MITTITKEEAECKVAELVYWLTHTYDVKRERKLKEAQRDYWIGKLVLMDEYKIDKIVIRHNYNPIN